MEAIGLTAAFSRALAENGLTANVVAGYYHDHMFVQYTDAEKAVQVLQDLAVSKKKGLESEPSLKKK